MESLLIATGINTKDLDLLASIVNNNPDKQPSYLVSIAKRVLKSFDIQHAIVLGYLIGYVDATEQTHHTYYKSLSPCQRQN